MDSNFGFGNLNFDQLRDQYTGQIRMAINDHVPTAIYNQATQMNLADMALNSIVQGAVSGVAANVVNTGIGQQISPLLTQVPGMLQMARQFGLDQFLQQALNSTDLDEQLRDAVIEGFSRYLRDNAGRLAQVALQAIVNNAGNMQR